MVGVMFYKRFSFAVSVCALFAVDAAWAAYSNADTTVTGLAGASYVAQLANSAGQAANAAATAAANAQDSANSAANAAAQKVNVALGSGKANMFLITDAAGNVVPVAVTESGTGTLVTDITAKEGKLTVDRGAKLPTVGTAILTIQNGATNTAIATFGANATSPTTATIPAASPTIAGLGKVGVIPSGSATSTTYATIWVE